MPHPKHAVRIFIFFAAIYLPSVLGAEDAASQLSIFLADTTDQILISALETTQTDMDCSHLVHYLYERSGLDYEYANSIALYEGVKGFRRVTHPKPGDVIVWRGHVGIVLDPLQHSFISALRTGVKVSSYVSTYWKGRGVPHFFHYVG